ncbi:MAG TPA: efflux RND transporter periplasmic adaptor subunit [Rhodocyclaceae bacterium]|nr:efflux RND transporter periplasmic adaptor subunit [Rhodocyclaceae bacterium]
MKPQTRKRLIIAGVVIVAIAIVIAITRGGDKAEKPTPAAKASLSVTVESPLPMRLTQKISANGNIEAWQEAAIGANVTGLILADVKVNVGDVVKRGQLLANFSNQTVAADLEQTKAKTAEAEATAAEAEANAERARAVADSGALSKQQLNQYITAAQTAKARLNAQIAAGKAQAVRLNDTQVLAPDDGIISARNATVGSVPTTQELFRLIRQGRLEWRAEVSSLQIPLLKPGMLVTITPPNSQPIKGKVRITAPTVDAKTRNGIVYVDLPNPGPAKAGMFASGDFDVGFSDGLTLPQSAVMVRDGYSYVFKVGADGKVAQTKVTVGRRIDERVEILNGLSVDAKVVTAGGGFLTDGDTVRVVAPEAADIAPNTAAPAKN